MTKTASKTARPARAARSTTGAGTRRPKAGRDRPAPLTRPVDMPPDLQPATIREQVIAFKREQIIAAATELFFEHGYQRTTLDAVARKLNVTKPFIYYHFKDKEDLLAEISRRSIAKANEALAEALEATGSPTQRLHAVTRTLMRAVLDARRYTAIFFREQKNLSDRARAPLYRQHRQFDAMLVKLLEEGTRTGEFRIPDPALCALGIAGMVGWAYNWYNPAGRLTPDEICDGVAAMVLSLVGAAPDAAAVPGALAAAA